MAQPASWAPVQQLVAALSGTLNNRVNSVMCCLTYDEASRLQIDLPFLICSVCGVAVGCWVFAVTNTLMMPLAAVTEPCLNATAFAVSDLHPYEPLTGGPFVCMVTQAGLSIVLSRSGTLVYGLKASLRLPLTLLLLTEAGRDGLGPVVWPTMLLLMCTLLGMGVVLPTVWLPAALYGGGGCGISPGRVRMSLLLALMPVLIAAAVFGLDHNSRGWTLSIGLLGGPALPLLTCLLWPFSPPGADPAGLSLSWPLPRPSTPLRAREPAPAPPRLPPLDERVPGEAPLALSRARRCADHACGARCGAAEEEPPARQCARASALLGSSYALCAALGCLSHAAMLWHGARTLGGDDAAWAALGSGTEPAVTATLVDACGLSAALLLHLAAHSPAHATAALLLAPLLGPGGACAALLSHRERHADWSGDGSDPPHSPRRRRPSKHRMVELM